MITTLRNRILPIVGLLAGIALISPASQAQALTEIKVSYQPALYWALPFYIASEKGWWKELSLKPDFSTFPAGVPQIAASVSKSWDVGGTGSVPAILGFQRFGILTIGLTNDESAGNALVARGDKAEQFIKNPASIKGQTIVLTSNSTGERSCFSNSRCFRGKPYIRISSSGFAPKAWQHHNAGKSLIATSS